MFELKVLAGFAAAHRLTMVGEKCENMHGHNWKVEVVVRGDELDVGGVVMDFGELKKIVRRVVGQLDHRYLNDLPMFQDHAPSSECIARFIATQVADNLEHPAVSVRHVSAWESEDACATYYPSR